MRFSHNGARRFIAASTVKIAIMIELFRQVDAGRLSLEAGYRLRPGDKASGSGVVGQLHDGIEFTLADLAFLMMSISDNSATNILIDQIGQDRVNATMQGLGMVGSMLSRRMRGSHVDPGEQENWAVPDDYARAIGALFDGSAASARSCAAMLALLEAQQNDRRIARYLPRTDRPCWGSKTGSLPGVANDVGFVMTASGPLIMAVFWGCPAFVDGLWTWGLRVGFCCLHAGFVGHGRAVSQGRVQPDRVVPALDVAEAGHLRLGL